jgi:hypothetical protein
MTALGDDPAVHFIRDGRFVCAADSAAKCHNYPTCECEGWTAELHGEVPADGHENQPQDECWIKPWLEATDLNETYDPEDLWLSDVDFPDGPISTIWNGDYLTWEYADDTKPLPKDADA